MWAAGAKRPRAELSVRDGQETASDCAGHAYESCLPGGISDWNTPENRYGAGGGMASASAPASQA